MPGSPESPGEPPSLGVVPAVTHEPSGATVSQVKSAGGGVSSSLGSVDEAASCGCPPRPLSEVDEFQEADVQEADVQEADVQEAELQEAELQEADDQEAEFQEAELQEADDQDALDQDAEFQEAFDWAALDHEATSKTGPAADDTMNCARPASGSGGVPV